MKLYIRDLRTNKLHTHTIENKSCRYSVEGKHLVVRDYYTNKVLHRYDVSKFGSIEYWVE